jgi:hypothetical protein
VLKVDLPLSTAQRFWKTYRKSCVLKYSIKWTVFWLGKQDALIRALGSPLENKGDPFTVYSGFVFFYTIFVVTREVVYK